MNGFLAAADTYVAVTNDPPKPEPLPRSRSWTFLPVLQFNDGTPLDSQNFTQRGQLNYQPPKPLALRHHCNTFTFLPVLQFNDGTPLDSQGLNNRGSVAFRPAMPPPPRRVHSWLGDPANIVAMPDIQSQPIFGPPDTPRPLPPRGRASVQLVIQDDPYGPGTHLVGPFPAPPSRPAGPRPRHQWEHVDLNGVLADLPAPTAFLVQVRPPVPAAPPRNLTRQTNPADLLQADERTYYASLLPTQALARRAPLPAVGRSLTVQDTLEVMLDEVRVPVVWVGAPPSSSRDLHRLTTNRPTTAAANAAGGTIAAAGSQPVVADVIFVQQFQPRRAWRWVTQQVQVIPPPWSLGIVPGPFYVVCGQVSPAAGAVSGDVRAAGED